MHKIKAIFEYILAFFIVAILLFSIASVIVIKYHGEELKSYILHDICVVHMVLAFPRSKTVYLAISKNRPISIWKKRELTKDVTFWKYLKSSCTAPKDVKIYILHDLYVVNMVSVLPGSKTAYLAISKNRPISIWKKKIIFFWK